MFRKLLLASVAVAGLMVTVDASSADAGWRRAYRRGFYAAPRYYAPRRVYAAPVYSYGYTYPGYYGGYGYAYPYGYSYGYPGYYGGYYGGWGPGFGVQTRNFGFYVR
jgi:hypothetical protein